MHAEAALASSNFAPEVFEHSDVEKSGIYYTYDEPEYPLPTFQSPSLPLSGSVPVVNDASRMGPVRGPAPIYDKPYNAPA